MNSGAASFCTLCLWQPHQASPATTNFFINSFTTKHRKLSASKCGKRRVSPIKFHPRGSIFCSLEQNPCSGSSDRGSEQVPEANGDSESVLKRFVKPISCVILCIAVSLLPIRRIQAPALAAPVAVEVDGEEEEEVVDRDYTKRLLKAVSKVLRSIEEIRRGNGSVEELDAALKDVKAKKEEFEEQIVEGLEEELQELKTEKVKLMKRSESLVKESKKLKWQYEVMTKKGDKEKAGALVEKLGALDKKYEKIWDSLGDVEDSISRKETAAFSIGIREICFIERECEALVKRFKRDLMQKDTSTSPSAGPITRLSKDEIQKDLENAQRKYLAQMLLPRVMDNDESGALLDEDLAEFAVRIKQRLQEAREVQRDAEASIRRNMKKFGDEKRFVVNTPTDEVVKGYPEIELKWMFGDKEVVVPKATNVHLYHGWKKWREEVKAGLKKNLLEDVDFGKQYMAQRQERVLLERDRVVSKTWYNEEKSRWEIDPVAVPYAVSKKLVDSARIRHDWGIMYLTLKGDTVEYYVDIKAYDMLFEEFGGFDGLYMKMLASGVQTSVQLMWIPFSELSFQNQFLLAIKITRQCFIELWKNGTISSYRDDIFERYRLLFEDIAVNIFIPVVDFLLPYTVRMQLGIAWPEEITQNAGATPTWYLKWLYEADKNYHERHRRNFVFFQYLLLAIRTYVYGYILLNVLRFLKKNIRRLPGVYLYLWMFFGPLRRSPNYRKLRRLKAYVKYKRRRYLRRKKAGLDPIRTAFDSMKRVKNPPIPLKDFSSIESMREEINEVVAFLQNPSAFQEMGARAPRGVLIVGERGTGKTSLALAIAAEAKVPVVKIKAKQLEPGLWVGQSASNVRDLFQTARDLAPVIIFVEDFELFAGVRGRFIHTKNQDHEALINQLLVELDGFEKQDGVVLMATAKNLKQVDPALKRPGRMDRIFRLQNLSSTEREKILRGAAKETMDEEIVDFVDWKKVAEKTSILRPVELKLVPVALEGSAFRSKFVDTDELMSYISWFATFGFLIPNWIRKRKFAKKLSRMLVNHLGLSLTKEDLQNVVDLMEPYGQISNGIEFLNPPIDWTRESKFPHAVWAAGRGLIAHLLPNYDVVETLWLEPNSWQGIGCTKISKARTEGSVNNSQPRSHLEKKLVFCFGSYVAAQLLLPLGEENLLSARELRKAQTIATRMVIQYGWGPDDSPAVYYSHNARRTMNMGDAHEQEIAAKVEKMFDLAYSRARQMIQRNRRALEQIVEELLEFEVLSGKDLQRILESTGGSREKEPFSLVKVYNTQPTTSGFLEDGNGSSPILLGAPSN